MPSRGAEGRIRAEFDALLGRLEKGGVCAREARAGCTAAEIAALEKDHGFAFPLSYRLYLETLGRKSGRLFTHDHLAVTYDYVRTLTAEARATWLNPAAPREDGAPVRTSSERVFDSTRADDTLERESEAGASAPPPGFALPDKAFLIASRLGIAFEFIVCDGGADAPVHFFAEYAWPIRKNHDGVIAWLDAWRSAAEEAIASGYFDSQPQGTQP